MADDAAVWVSTKNGKVVGVGGTRADHAWPFKQDLWIEQGIRDRGLVRVCTYRGSWWPLKSSKTYHVYKLAGNILMVQSESGVEALGQFSLWDVHQAVRVDAVDTLNFMSPATLTSVHSQSINGSLWDLLTFSQPTFGIAWLDRCLTRRLSRDNPDVFSVSRFDPNTFALALCAYRAKWTNTEHMFVHQLLEYRWMSRCLKPEVRLVLTQATGGTTLIADELAMDQEVLRRVRALPDVAEISDDDLFASAPSYFAPVHNLLEDYPPSIFCDTRDATLARQRQLLAGISSTAAGNL